MQFFVCLCSESCLLTHQPVWPKYIFPCGRCKQYTTAVLHFTNGNACPETYNFFAYNLKSSLTDTLPKFLFASVIPPGFICLCHVQGRFIIEMLNEGKQIYHKTDCSLFFKALSAMAGTLGTTYLLSQLKAASMTLGSALTCHDNIVRQLWNH